LGREGRFRKGLWDLVDKLSAARYSTRDGQINQRIDLIGVDANWKPSQASVVAVANEHPRASWIVPCYGRGIGPSDAPMEEWKPKDGERKGPWWILRPTLGGGRHCVVDTNQAKSFTNARLNVAMGDDGAISLFAPAMVTEHRMIAEHWRAEVPRTQSVAGGRSVEMWSLPPAKPDNHFWDCLVGAVTMASIRGARLAELQSKKRPRARKIRPKASLKV
jgi:hypothetical protein